MKLKKIAEVIKAELKGDGDKEIKGVAALESSGPDDICLYLGGRFKKDLEQSKTQTLVVASGRVVEGFNLLQVERPRLMFSKVIKLFHTEKKRSGIHPTAFISDTAVIGKNVFIGPFACVGDNASVGDGSEIHDQVVIYEDVQIGKNCRIYASSVIREATEIGDRVIIQPGAVIGADGFGYEPDEKGVYQKIPQVGRVVLEDDVEIGANTCIDRAALGESRVGKGTKIDNLCQLGHGDKIGHDTVISGMVGISGSVRVGNNVVIGGNAGITDHVTIGDGAMIAGKAGVSGNVPPGTIAAGFPHTDLRTWKKAMVNLYRSARKSQPPSPGKDKE